MEQVHQHQPAFGGESCDGLHIQLEVVVPGRQVGDRPLGWLFEGRRSDQHDHPRLLLPGGDQFTVGSGEPLETRPPGQRFHLSELGDNHRRADPTELLVSFPEPIRPPAFDHGPLAEHRVGFPGQVPEPGPSRRESTAECRFEMTGLLQPDHVGPAGQHNHVALDQRKTLGRIQWPRTAQDHYAPQQPCQSLGLNTHRAVHLGLHRQSHYERKCPLLPSHVSLNR